MDYIALLNKFEKEIIGEHISEARHTARLEFAHWLNQHAVQPSVQRTGLGAYTYEELTKEIVRRGYEVTLMPRR